ncbi:Nuclear pore complex, Nup214/CAN component [Balamuthia mandrillaris]
MATRKRRRPTLEELATECRLEEQQLEERNKREPRAEEEEEEDESEGEEEEEEGPTLEQLFQNGRVYQALKDSEASWDSLVKLPEGIVLGLGRELQPFVLRHRARGRTPSLTWLDHALLLLLLYSLACTLDELASRFRLKASTVEGAINRIRPLLLELLQARWWQADRRRPAPLMKEDALSPHAHVALLVDSASLEVYRPRTTSAEESKLYYDEKNRIHALKKEVAVMASPPHLALFAFPGAAGSRQDHSILKEHYAAYIPYLTKTAAEEALLQPVDGEEACWSALFGSRYAWCNALDTPGLRRVVLKKRSELRTNEGRLEDRELAAIHAPVECFFGRMHRLWALLRTPYPYDRSKFDTDIDLVILLTNEHVLGVQPLAEEDQRFYRAHLRARRAAAIERIAYVSRRHNKISSEERREDDATHKKASSPEGRPLPLFPKTMRDDPPGERPTFVLGLAAFTAATPPKPKVQFLEEEDDESAELQRREELDAFLALLQEDEQPQQQTATTATANSPLLKEPDFDFAKELEREEEYEKLRKGVDLEEAEEEEEEGNGKSGKGSFYNAMMDGVDLSFIEGQTDELSVFIRQTDRENRKLAVDAEWMQTVPEWIDYEIQSDMAFQRLQDEFDERSEKGESITAERVKKLHDDMEQVRKKLEEDFTDKAADRLYMESLARGELLPGIEEDLKFAQSVYGVTADDDDYDEDDDYDDEDEDDDYEDEDDEDYDDEDDYEDEEDEGDEDDDEENKRRNSATLKKNI